MVKPPKYLVHLMNYLDVQVHAVGQIHEIDHTSIVNWKKHFQAKALEHDLQIEAIGKFVTDSEVKVSSLIDKFFFQMTRDSNAKVGVEQQLEEIAGEKSQAPPGTS